jgi:hypothetical protein
MNVNTNTFQTGLGCNLDIGTTHAIKTKAIWKRKFPVKGNKLKILWFSYRSHVNYFNFHSGLTSSRSHVNGALQTFIYKWMIKINEQYTLPLSLKQYTLCNWKFKIQLQYKSKIHYTESFINIVFHFSRITNKNKY